MDAELITARSEAERQLAAAAERHREAADSTQELGRSESGRHVAIKSLGRAVHLVSYALRRADASGVPFERLVELTGWEPDLVREGLVRVPQTRVIARLSPPGVDAESVADAAAGFEAVRHLQELAERVLADIDAEWATPVDLEALHDRLEAVWASWREEVRPRA